MITYLFFYASLTFTSGVKATLIKNGSNCSASCEVSWPQYTLVTWEPLLVSTTLTALTVITIVNAQQNATRYSTKRASLPESITFPPTNANGTRICVIPGKRSTDPSTTLAFPTFLKGHAAEYSWSGRLSTTIGNASISACLSPTTAVAALHNAPSDYEYVPAWASELLISADPYGLNHGCTSTRRKAKLAAPFSYDDALQSCRIDNNATLFAVASLHTAAWLTTVASVSWEGHLSTTTSSHVPMPTQTMYMRPWSPASPSRLAPQTTTPRASENSLIANSRNQALLPESATDAPGGEKYSSWPPNPPLATNFILKGSSIIEAMTGGTTMDVEPSQTGSHSIAIAPAKGISEAVTGYSQSVMVLGSSALSGNGYSRKTWRTKSDSSTHEEGVATESMDAMTSVGESSTFVSPSTGQATGHTSARVPVWSSLAQSPTSPSLKVLLVWSGVMMAF